MKTAIDINCDLGEGIGNDQQLMPLISSCSIACGGHYGDESTIYETLLLAKKFKVKVGAHPSFPDKPNFGRVPLSMTSEALEATVCEQLKRFLKICNEVGMEMHHVKLHGALYNLAAKDNAVAETIVQALRKSGVKSALYVPPNSAIGAVAKKDFEIIYEAFIDRRYNPDLTLVSRTQNEKALILNPLEAWEQLKMMLFGNQVRTADGTLQAIEASTFCLHGDHPFAEDVLKYLHVELQKNGIAVL